MWSLWLATKKVAPRARVQGHPNQTAAWRVVHITIGVEWRIRSGIVAEIIFGAYRYVRNRHDKQMTNK